MTASISIHRLRASETRADRMVRDFAGCAGTQDRARPLAKQDGAEGGGKASVLTLLKQGKPRVEPA